MDTATVREWWSAVLFTLPILLGALGALVVRARPRAFAAAVATFVVLAVGFAVAGLMASGYADAPRAIGGAVRVEAKLGILVGFVILILPRLRARRRPGQPAA